MTDWTGRPAQLSLEEPHALKSTSHEEARAARSWSIGRLVKAIADSLDSRFNPVTVQGEITGFSRATSGHCYFALKDEDGQIRCAMFRRAAFLLDFTPREGQRVEVRGRIGVYEPRGDLQLIAESLREVGEGNLFERFLQLKGKLEAEGLFDTARKKRLPPMPKTVGVVTSLGAAALFDVLSTLQRRVPHVSVVIYPSIVQGTTAASQLVMSMRQAFDRREVDIILLVRGGGAMEDLWCFNNEELARTISSSPIPVISGIGHETDFTIADFTADLRAPTPTAAAELCGVSQEVLHERLEALQAQLDRSTHRRFENLAQRLDMARQRLCRPTSLLDQYQGQLSSHARSLGYLRRSGVEQARQTLLAHESRLAVGVQRMLQTATARQASASIRLSMLDPRNVLKRGYAWLTDEAGSALKSVSDVRRADMVTAILADGEVDLAVRSWP